MIQRLRHLHFSTDPMREHNVNDDEEQTIPIYDAIAKAVRYWDILGLAKYDDLAYEDTVVWLLQHLPEAHDFHSIESLILQAFAEQQGSHQFAPDQSLMLKALADDLWHAWSQYLQRHEQSAFAQARSRARGLMSRHYYPRTNRR